MPLSSKAEEARRAYKRAWYSANKEKQKEYNERYWSRKAEASGAPDEEPISNSD